MALDLHGATVDDDEMLTIWVDGADALFARLRAGESYTVEQEWDGRQFVLVDPCGTRLAVAEAPAPTTAELEVRLDTDEFEFDERSEWYVRLGFVEGEERESDEGAERILEAGPLQIVLHETNQSSALVTELD
ncbi:MAG: hypothetical protein K1X95_09030 [Acidimicrobiia bacterium]|nr:hypothetical protein [Acidimicrobiia bacterium]